MNDLFEKAVRNKIRFTEIGGSMTIEDLWDLPLSVKILSLDNLAKAINRKLKDSEEESFVAKSTPANTELKIKLELVKYIISVKMEEAEARKNAVEKREKKAQLLELIAEKENESLKGKSLDELKAMVDNL